MPRSYQVVGEVIEWRGPAPHHFVALPDDLAQELADDVAHLSYGWGCIPAEVTLGDTTVATSLMPRDGGYLVPLKVALRRPEGVELGDVVSLRVTVAD